MAGQTKGGGKPAGFSIFGRSPILEDEEEVAVMLPPASAAPLGVCPDCGGMGTQAI
jgi:hypothetical protein